MSKAVEVPTSCGFFGPGDVEVLFDALDANDGLFGGPVFVAVDEEARSVGCDAEGLLHDADASEVGFHVESDFEFAAVDAVFGHSSVEGEDGVVVEAEVDTAGVGLGAAFAGSEGEPEGFVVDLGFEVPECGVDGVDGGVHLAFVSAFEYEVDEAHPESDYGSRVFAFDEVEEASDGGLPPGATPVMPSSVSIHRTAPPEMSSPTTPLASPMGRSIFISYCSTRYPVIFMICLALGLVGFG